MSRLARLAAPYLLTFTLVAVSARAPAVYADPPAPAIQTAAPTTSPPAKPRAARAKTVTLHGEVKSVEPGALIISGTGSPDLKVTLTPRGRALRSGKAAAIGDFHAGEAVVIRGHPSLPDGFTATLLMDSASEKLAALARRPPLLKIAGIDAARGEITLQSVNGDLFVRALKSRIRVGRKELGDISALQVGQVYRARLSNGTDAEPSITLTASTAAAATGKLRKRSAPKNP